ncbi:MAG: adenylate/guanylate cyclase domain-containing protein [Chloroflexota bacterium]
MSVPMVPAPPSSIVVCAVCGTNNSPLARFCGSCGTRLLFYCWSCGTVATVGQPYCQSCGEALTPESAGHDGDAPRRSVVARPTVMPAPAFAPPPALPLTSTVAPAETAQTNGVARVPSPTAAQNGSADDFDPDEIDVDDDLDEERRVVSVLFADIVGFTTLSERLDPEDVRELSAAVLARLAEAVSLYGGTIDKFMGDAVMALFGAPVAHEDDPVRAVHAALAMHQAVAALHQLDRDGNELELRLRIGINSGEVIAGIRDVGGHREYSVFGDVVNTAARLQTAANPGNILLGEETARQAGAVFDVTPIEPLVLKGKTQPVPAFKVRGTLTPATPALGATATMQKSPLVGRLTELRELRTQMQELARGRGRLTAIIGEHGVGKSRLLAEAREHGEELGLRWVEAIAPSHAQALSYRLIREILARLLDLRPGASEARLVEALSEKLEQLGLLDLLTPLGLAMGAESDVEPTAGLTAQQLQWRVVDAARRLLRALMADRPLVLVLDALQWADPSSIELLIELMSMSDETPILFVYVFTPEPDAPSWQLKEQAARAFPHRYAELSVGPLPESAARELMCSLLACADTPAHVEELVLARTEGNPFFIEEVLRALIDSGALRYDNDRWVADGDIHDLAIPNTLLAAVMARIDRLPAGVRRTLQIAAVIGRELSERVLRRVADGGPELDRHIREALRAGLLREETVIPERRYAFTQLVIQEAAARSLLVRRRREIHVQVGWALEEIYADNLEEQYGELARHFWEGESWERAFRYSRLAAEQAAAAYANDEAIGNFTIAIESAARSAAGASPKVVALLCERRGDLRALTGEYDAALVDYRAAIEHHVLALKELDTPSGDEADASPAAAASVAASKRTQSAIVGSLALKMARLHSYQGQVAPARQKLALAFERLPADSPELSGAWSLKAASYVWDSDTVRAAEAARKALQIARERGSFQHLGPAYEALTHPALMGVLGRELHELSDEWVALARERPEDRQVLFKALTARGLVHVWAFWEFDEGLQAEMLEALEIARATQSTADDNTVRGILGAGRFLLGEWTAAEADLRRAAGQSTTLVGVGAIYEWWLMLLLTLRGEIESAAEQMTAWLEDTANTHRQVLMHALLGFNRFLAGDDDAARAAIAQGSEVAAALNCAQCDVTLHMLAAETLAELGDEDSAASHAKLARDGGERFGRQAASIAADRAEAVLALRDSRIDHARQLLERARRQAEALQQPFEVARTLLVQARLHEASGNDFAAVPVREQAQAMLTALGCPVGSRLVRSRSGPPRRA